ncbi:hypothetical protein AXG93_1040s1370 [Marchantia polymorpha subsp. ruderalis]|uniref:Uncharacterized protein n=1 Tax=Marchantia polymorpha subsp. ruderalis TaxID=1480154 RepID=A0A176VG93_MARPO|nr:hypothetical protein AXG93_1040s1370 [Marchantia polymorpha subsp. ruderalis]
MSKNRTRLKKKANRRRVVSDSSESSVAKSDATASTTDKEMREEPTLRAEEGVSLEVRNKTPIKVKVEPLEERTATVSPSLPLSERMQSMKGEEVPQPKTSEELAKELTLSEDILKQVVAQMVALKTERMELRGKNGKRTEVHSRELQRANELTLKESRARAKKAEAAYQQLREETTDSLRLCVDKCMHGFAMWEVQTLKWLKLDLLERLLISMKINGAAGHKQLVRLVNSFSSGLEEACENLEIEILSMLRRLGADGSSEDAVATTSDELHLRVVCLGRLRCLGVQSE